MTRKRRATIAILLPLAAAAPACALRQQQPAPAQAQATPTTLPATAAATTAPVAPLDPVFAALVNEFVKIELNRNCFGTTPSAPPGAAEPATQP